jgi:hypothetical protein
MTFFCFASGLNSIWPPPTGGSDFPFWNVSDGVKVTWPVIVWAVRLIGVQVAGRARFEQ